MAQHQPPITHVEGWELTVLRGFDLKRFQPRVLIVENLFNSKSYRRTLRRLGYTRWRRLKPNEIYIRRRSVWATLRGMLGRRS